MIGQTGTIISSAVSGIQQSTIAAGPALDTYGALGSTSCSLWASDIESAYTDRAFSPFLYHRPLLYSAKMITSTQLAMAFSRRQLVHPSCALAETVLLSEILTTLSFAHPLWSQIDALFKEQSEGDED